MAHPLRSGEDAAIPGAPQGRFPCACEPSAKTYSLDFLFSKSVPNLLGKKYTQHLECVKKQTEGLAAGKDEWEEESGRSLSLQEGGARDSRINVLRLK
jgi:hypothetical protein